MENIVRFAAPELIAHLQIRLLHSGYKNENTAVVFDADGTLWTRDVGEDLFEAALGQNLICEQARPALLQVAAEYSIEDGGSVSELATRLYAAYRQRIIPEQRGAEMLVWCYAGWRSETWRDFANDMLNTVCIEEYYYQPAVEVLRWAKDQQLRVLVISASPQAAIEAAVARLGVEATAVIAGTPKVCDDVIITELAQPLPWGKFKASAGRALLAETHWLATFGDSAFDMAMMLEADHAVAVRPKSELRKCFADHADGNNAAYRPMLIELVSVGAT